MNLVKFRRVCVALLIYFASTVSAGELLAIPLPKQGACPSGYSSSRGYCKPNADAKFAIAKVGNCPNGYSTSGNYCLASRHGKRAIPKAGACPSGYSTSWDYCLANKK